MESLRLRISHAPRLPTFPLDDEALGAELWRELTVRRQRGEPRPTLFVFSADEAQIVDLAPILARGGDVHRGISSFAAIEGASALAATGTMTRAVKGRITGRFAVAFIEWADGRWWCCTRALESGGMQVADAEDEISRAIDGAPRPAGLGSWFGRMRFEGLTISLKRQEEDVN